MKKVITFGTFDLLHEGHIKILERAAKEGDYLIVGVSSDKLNATKGKRSYFNESQRLHYISALECVDEVFLEESLELKDEYVKKYGADLLVMGDDWTSKFDWVSCKTKYLPRTPDISSTAIKDNLFERLKCRKLLFADTYIKKHYDCAMAFVSELLDNNVAPIITNSQDIPEDISADAIVFFNYPAKPLPRSLDNVPRILVDHGASNLKWFLANKTRFAYFDYILTAGPDHTDSLLSFFPGVDSRKVRSVGYIKSSELLKQQGDKAEICRRYNLSPDAPIVFFAPTWYKSAQQDIQEAMKIISNVSNHAVLLHPETQFIDTSGTNNITPEPGAASQLLKVADVVVTDTSSIIFEAAALGKPAIQLLLREYSDNGAVIYDLPYSAGSMELFIGGMAVKPGDLEHAIDLAVSGTPEVLREIQIYQERILKGTYIRKDSVKSLCEELKSCLDAGLNRTAPELVDQYYSIGQRNFDLKKALVETHLIAHGGGNFEGNRVSNTQDAFNAAIAVTNIIELDIVEGSDGPLIAHDSEEGQYGLKKPFSETPAAEFLKLRYQGNLAPLSIQSALKRVSGRNKFINFDIKEIGKRYQNLSEQLFNAAVEANALENVIIQAYCLDDVKHLQSQGFRNILLAVWKYYYKDPLGKEAMAFISNSFELSQSSIVGISMPYSNKHMTAPSIEDSRLNSLKGYWRRIFIHGAPVERYSEILQSGYGLFADGFGNDIEFKDVPHRFNWRHYAFLNPDLLDLGFHDEVSLTRHYVKHGEKRWSVYDVPEQFDCWDYFRSRPDIRKAGVSGINSIKSHKTRFEAET